MLDKNCNQNLLQIQAKSLAIGEFVQLKVNLNLEF